MRPSTGDIATLLALEELRTLKARYVRGVDTWDWELFRSVFTDDCRFEIADWGEPLIGADTFVARVKKSRETRTVRSVHHGHTPELTLHSADEASGVWAMADRLVRDDDAGQREVVEGAGHYHETYRRTADGWRIASLRLTRLRFDVRPARDGEGER